MADKQEETYGQQTARQSLEDILSTLSNVECSLSLAQLHAIKEGVVYNINKYESTESSRMAREEGQKLWYKALAR